MSIQRYPIGLQDFSEVITRGCVYVDKTSFVLRLINTHKYYFLSRPRRFGKSLLISTFDYLFRGKKELFEGLFIYDNWEFEEYPVIKISFSSIGYREIPLSESIYQELISIGKSYDVKLKASAPSQVFDELIEKLHQKFNKKVVVLIDEYDKPLIDYLDKDNLHKAMAQKPDIATTHKTILYCIGGNEKLILFLGNISWYIFSVVAFCCFDPYIIIKKTSPTNKSAVAAVYTVALNPIVCSR